MLNFHDQTRTKRKCKRKCKRQHRYKSLPQRITRPPQLTLLRSHKLCFTVKVRMMAFKLCAPSYVSRVWCQCTADHDSLFSRLSEFLWFIPAVGSRLAIGRWKYRLALLGSYLGAGKPAWRQCLWHVHCAGSSKLEQCGGKPRGRQRCLDWNWKCDLLLNVGHPP